MRAFHLSVLFRHKYKQVYNINQIFKRKFESESKKIIPDFTFLGVKSGVCLVKH